MTSPMSTGNHHLDQDELLLALAQSPELPASRQEHLISCQTCSQASVRMLESFDRIGRAARLMAPSPSRPFRLPQMEQGSGLTRRSWRFRLPVLTAATAAVILIGFALLWSGFPGLFDLQPFGNPAVPPTASYTLEQDRELMEEIDALVENALPPAFNALVATGDPELDEDLINWIVPSIEEENNV